MPHDHSHDMSTDRLKWAFWLNLAFALIEVVGGLFTNSLAILSDALHDLGDSLSLGLSWYFQKYAQKGRTRNFTYGYKRFSLLGAIINGLVLAVGSGIILSQALPQLFQPQDSDALGMFWLALLGIAVNGAAAFRLRKGHSENEKVVSLHLLEDVLGWVAVLIGSAVMYYTGALWIDPLLSILIALFVLFQVYRRLRKSLHIILQGTPEDIAPEKIEAKALQFPEVQEVHDCHIWSLDGQYHILSMHLRLRENYTLEAQAGLKDKLRKSLHHAAIQHITLELEGPKEACGQAEGDRSTPPHQ